MAKGLIVKREWLNEMFVNGKRWEMRSTNTKYRGEFNLIEQGSGLVVGRATLIDSFKVDQDLAKRSVDIHKVKDVSLLEKWCWAWSLTDVIKYDKPIPYTHPYFVAVETNKGNITWCLDENLEFHEDGFNDADFTLSNASKDEIEYTASTAETALKEHLKSEKMGE